LKPNQGEDCFVAPLFFKTALLRRHRDQSEAIPVVQTARRRRAVSAAEGIKLSANEIN
jgi:hypothetical protein